MSLDFELYKNRQCVFDANITHNLIEMAQYTGLYDVLWRPEENGITRASQCLKPLGLGLAALILNKEECEKFNSTVGWGRYEHFVTFVARVLVGCNEHQTARVKSNI